MSDNPLAVLDGRLARGEITKEQYVDIIATLRERQQDPINIPLIAISTAVVLLFACLGALTPPSYHSTGIAILVWVVVCLIWPLLVLWMRAVWNNIVPRVTGWRKLSFWEAAGISLVLALFGV